MDNNIKHNLTSTCLVYWYLFKFHYGLNSPEAKETPNQKKFPASVCLDTWILLVEKIGAKSYRGVFVVKIDTVIDQNMLII